MQLRNALSIALLLSGSTALAQQQPSSSVPSESAASGAPIASGATDASSASATATATATASSASASATGNTTAPGFKPGFSTRNDSDINFGDHWAALHLDYINSIVGSVNTTEEGQQFINNSVQWVDAVHALPATPSNITSPTGGISPLTIWSRIYYSTPQAPELKPGSPRALGTNPNSPVAVESSPGSQIYPAFNVSENDVVIRKSRYYAGAGNQLEQVLESQHIDTVVLSGIRTSGVILSTAYRLADLDYAVYVISDNVIETPPDGALTNDGILEGVFPKIPVYVISLEQAMNAIGSSTSSSSTASSMAPASSASSTASASSASASTAAATGSIVMMPPMGGDSSAAGATASAPSLAASSAAAATQM